MSYSLGSMLEYAIDSHHVTCTEGEQRRWYCDCSDYEQRLAKYGEGFCEHLVHAIEAMQADLGLTW